MSHLRQMREFWAGRLSVAPEKSEEWSEGFRTGWTQARHHERLVAQIRARGATPTEALFYEEYLFTRIGGLEFQHRVLGYRIDFCHLATKIAIELDGLGGHASKEDIEKDRRRQREIEAFGYTFIRFGNGEITKNVSKCIDEVVDKIFSLTNVR